MKKIINIVVVVAVLFATQRTPACTNYLITRGASIDGSTMISYAADSHVLYGELYHWPARTWPAGSMLNVHEWDTGKFLGQIEQVPSTYNVVGNMNEHQLAIGETTYGGLEQLETQSGAIMDYGSLIYITLQRAKNAREAIKVMHELVSKYGYYSSGESFSIADKDEVWIMELIGKGEGEKGAVWVALRIPDGYVSGHANQARITTFPLDSEENSISTKSIDRIFDENIECVYAEDVVSFAKRKGLYEGEDQEFSFSDVYAPVDFGGARFCEMRVWTMFNRVADGMDQHWDYAKGQVQHAQPHVEGQPMTPANYATNRMPLWIKPEKKVSVQDMFAFMRDHLEGTELDMSKDAGAGPFGVPYRWRPLTWKVDDVKYCNERATATQQTGFSFVSQSRNWLPDPVGGIHWWGVDDASGTVYMPFYCCMTEAPHNFAEGNGSLMEWSDTAGFWVFNQVQNLAYTRYNYIHPDIEAAQQKLEQEFVDAIPATDEEARKLFETSESKAVEFLTNYSKGAADQTFKSWKSLYGQLFMKYMDGNIKTPKEVPEGYKFANPDVEQPGYSEKKYKQIITETGERFKVTDDGH